LDDNSAIVAIDIWTKEERKKGKGNSRELDPQESIYSKPQFVYIIFPEAD